MLRFAAAIPPALPYHRGRLGVRRPDEIQGRHFEERPPVSRVHGDVCKLVRRFVVVRLIFVPRRELAQRAWAISEGMTVRYEWVPRAKNKRADELSNEAIDNAK